MNTRYWLIRSAVILVILVLIFSTSIPASAAKKSPFVGNWEAVDVDGSGMTLMIGGAANGPFRITSYDNYISFCRGQAGIVYGVGFINPEDPNLLEADLLLQCFISGESLALEITFRYHPFSNTLSIYYDFGAVTIWHRQGPPQAPPPFLGLRVNYGDDWVESFYEAGHTVWVVVKDEGGNIKGVAEMLTEAKDFWGGETGFQTTGDGWRDANGDPLDNPPDIQPYDWVYGWVDNGAAAAVQIGEITAQIHLAEDSIVGSVNTPWDLSEVSIECHSWGSGTPKIILDTSVIPNGSDEFTCNWADQWDILMWQTVGVAYNTPDGHWVANTFWAGPNIHAGVVDDWFWVAGFYPGTLNWAIYSSNEPGGLQLASGDFPDYQGDLAFFGRDVHNLDFQVGNYIVVSDGVNEKGLVLQLVTMTIFDVEADYMEGTAPEGTPVYAYAGYSDWQYQVEAVLTPGPEPGRVTWSADYTTVDYDITEGMRQGSFALIFDEDWDSNEAVPPPPPPNPHFTIFPEWEWYDGMDWPDSATVYITVDGKPECNTQGMSSGNFFNGGFPEGCDVVVGDIVHFNDGSTERWHQVRNLSILNVDKAENTVTGIADDGAHLINWVHGLEGAIEIDAGIDPWQVDFDDIGIDLVEGITGRAMIPDEVGNATAVDWYIPKPRFTIYPESEWFEGMDWPNGVDVVITVDEKPECGVTMQSWGSYFSGSFGEDCDVIIGDMVRFTDGITERWHTVRDLTILGVDKVANTVTGTAPSGSLIHIWVDGFYENSLYILVGSDPWVAEFDDVGIDLVEGMGGLAIIEDEYSNTTAVGWYIPNPRIVASIPEDWFYLQDYTPNAEVSFAIFDSLESVTPTYQRTATTDGGGFVWVNPEGNWNLEPGSYLVISDGTNWKDLLVEGFTFDIFNISTGHLEGTAPPPYGRRVFTGIGWWDREGWSVEVNTNEVGVWEADFGQPIPSDYAWVYAQIFDGDGDASEIRPAPQPPGPGLISIWHIWSGDYLQAISNVFYMYMEEHPDVRIDLYWQEDITTALEAAIPAGEGPDIIAYPDDQIGNYAQNNFIVPLDGSLDMTFLEATYEPVAVAGMVWQDQIWGLPESQEAITLVYNKAVASEADFPADPADFADLLAKAQAYYTDHGIPLFCNQGFSGYDAYHVAPLFFEFDHQPYVDDLGNVYVNTPGKVLAGEWLVSVIPYMLPAMDHMTCRNALIAGEVAAWWTGPWAIADLEANGVDFGFVKMGKPFVGIKSLMLSSNAAGRGNAEIALDIMKFFTGYDMQKYMTLANKSVPANSAALNDPEVQALPAIAGFGANASLGFPMGNTPYAAFQWGPLGEAVAKIWYGILSPLEALAEAQAAIEAAIAAMP